MMYHEREMANLPTSKNMRIIVQWKHLQWKRGAIYILSEYLTIWFIYLETINHQTETECNVISYKTFFLDDVRKDVSEEVLFVDWNDVILSNWLELSAMSLNAVRFLNKISKKIFCKWCISDTLVLEITLILKKLVSIISVLNILFLGNLITPLTKNCKIHLNPQKNLPSVCKHYPCWHFYLPFILQNWIKCTVWGFLSDFPFFLFHSLFYWFELNPHEWELFMNYVNF